MSLLTLTLVQSNLVWEDVSANLLNLEKKISSVNPSTQVLILPEMFSTGFSMRPEKLAETMDGPTVEWMRNQAVKQRMILTGSLIIREGEDYFNRLLWVLPDGSCGYYDKRHLFAFAGEDLHYSSGNRRLVASVNGWRILLLICYDLRFPVWSRQSIQTDSSGNASDPEYDLIIYVANWPEKRSHAWKTLLQARAIENQCYVAAVNRVGEDGNAIYHSGDSMLVDPMGDILATCSHEDWLYTAAIDKKNLNDIRSRLPFLRDADTFHLEIG
jgi:predicted amidohydrolase